MSRSEPPTTDETILLLREIRDSGRRTVELLEELRDRRRAASDGGRPARTQPPVDGDGPDKFPNFGQNANGPIRGASMKDLDFYRAKAEASLTNPKAARFVDGNRALIAAIDEEIRRHLSQQPHQPGDAPPEFS